MIVNRPPGAGSDDFDRRVSIATVTSSRAFSTFPGTDRATMWIEGVGLRLRGADPAHRLDRLHEPFAFRGDSALVRTLLGDATRNLNVMSRRGRTKASARSAALARSTHLREDRVLRQHKALKIERVGYRHSSNVLCNDASCSLRGVLAAAPCRIG